MPNAELNTSAGMPITSELGNRCPINWATSPLSPSDFPRLPCTAFVRNTQYWTGMGYRDELLFHESDVFRRCLI